MNFTRFFSTLKNMNSNEHIVTNFRVINMLSYDVILHFSGPVEYVTVISLAVNHLTVYCLTVIHFTVLSLVHTISLYFAYSCSSHCIKSCTYYFSVFSQRE